MPDLDSGEDTCKNCGHKLESHLKEKEGKCKGDAENNDGAHKSYSWCIANCEKFWE